MDAIGTSALQEVITQCQSNGNFLILNGTRGIDILQIHPGTLSGLLDHMEESVEIFIPQSSCLNLYALILLINMDCPENAAICNVFSQFRKLLIELFLRNLSQNFFSKELTDLLQFIGDSCIFISEICVVSAAVDATATISGGTINYNTLCGTVVGR